MHRGARHQRETRMAGGASDDGEWAGSMDLVREVVSLAAGGGELVRHMMSIITAPTNTVTTATTTTTATTATTVTTITTAIISTTPTRQRPKRLHGQAKPIPPPWVSHR